ncbi:Rad4 beta-hairpin domain 3-domain-containing protein [Russula emetica]|nr:Rad4 beta-hairpin domain 3-domain-containing protein [Russula emetica]
MVYVIAVEEDGYMRDVTPRYAKQYSAKVAKVQSGGKGRREWWSQVVQTVTRPYKLHRDDVEDDELIVNQFHRGNADHNVRFQRPSLVYVLERHLLRDQVITQDAHELGKFRGEPVYSRSQVLQLKAAENWLRHGRVVCEGEQPLKYVKQRAATINRRRELEIRAETEGANSGGAVMQGLYAEEQTEAYVPPPVIDGKIPKNNFGNIDLYTPSMLPAGAAYIPHKGAAKIARQLGFDYAEAVTSFEFRKGKAFPVISGIVVATDNEDTILEAYWEAEHAAAQKEQEKRQQAVLNRWTKLVQGLRIRQRMREQYGGGTHGSGTLGVGDVGSSPAVASGNSDDHDGRDDEGRVQPATVGGFLTGVEDVVKPYSLPRPIHVVFSSPPRSPNSNGSSPPPAIAGPVPGSGTLVPSSSCFPAAANDDDDDDEAGEERGQQVPPTFSVEDVEEVEMDNMSGLELEGAQSQSTQRVRRMPKSMAALAAEAEAQAQATTDVDVAVTPHISEGEEAAAASSTASRSLRRSATRATPGTKPKTKTETTAGTGTPSRSRGRKRTRTQDDDDDDEAAASSGVSGLGSEYGSDGEKHVNGGRPRVAKRARRKHRRGSAADANGELLAPVPPSDRVLRTRKGKSPAMLA